MASLWKRPDSRYWIACFDSADGRRLKRSTRCINRRDALKVAEGFEAAARQKRTSRQIRRVFQDLHEEVLGEGLPMATTRSFIEGWIVGRKGEVAKSTFTFYDGVARRFIEFLGSRADDDLADVEPRDIVSFRDAMAKRVAAGTANHYIKALRMMFRDAKRDGWIVDNPAEDVKSLRKSAAAARARRAFTVAEISKVLKEAGNTEWRTLILLGLYTGQRLGDLATLRWNQIDLDAGEISFLTKKTGRRVLVPICDPLRKRLLEIPVSDNPNAPLLPESIGFVERAGGKVTTLSRQFGEMLERAGLRVKRAANGHGKLKDRSGEGHNIESVSFHSFRHTAVSMMKNAGISPAIVQDLVGHESAEISAHYTHVEGSAKAEALRSLPDLA